MSGFYQAAQDFRSQNVRENKVNIAIIWNSVNIYIFIGLGYE